MEIDSGAIGLSKVGEFLDAEAERAFRLQQRTMEQRQLRVLWLLALLFFLLYGLLDSRGPSLLGAAPWQWAPRLLIVASGLLVLGFEGRVENPRKRDGFSCAALLIAGLAYALMLLWRDPADLSLGGAILLVAGMYLFSPGRFLLVCSCATACTAAIGLALLFRPEGGVGNWIAYSYLAPANLLAGLALVQLNRGRRLGFFQQKRLQEAAVARQKAARALRSAHRRNRELLYNTLPTAIARQLMQSPGKAVADFHPLATVIFVDLVDFSRLSRGCAARELVDFLDGLFSHIDGLAAARGVEKIKTIGDAWMGAAGLGAAGLGVAGLDGLRNPDRGEEQATSVLGLARDLQCSKFGETSTLGQGFELRIGIHCGPLVGGVIGKRRYAFDIWGKTVNIAARLQGAACPGQTLVSAECRLRCPGHYIFGPVRRLQLKGCGEIEASHFYATGSGIELPGDMAGAGFGRHSGSLHG